MSELAKYDAARYALSVAVEVDEVKDIRDKAEAMAAYARQAKDTELVQWATEIKVRAERRAGQMLAEMPKAKGGNPQFATGNTMVPVGKTLAEIGISKNESSRWQKLAAVTESQFEDAVAAAKEVAGEVTTAAMLRVARAEKQENPDNPPVKPLPKPPAPAPTPQAQAPADDDAPPDYTEMDQAREQIEELQAELVVARMGDIPEDQKRQAADHIAALQAEVKTLNATLTAVKLSRDSLMEECSQMKRQMAMQRKEIERLKSGK